ncbi:immunoglobulin superfamily containing leucine-rich repeat protein 2 [Amia ocellicauda]|uniref:immunoglobulin superfamily containing leucine-rich repeat protein 2 n=1 Tax=Amia ocellicauda TaxID=2972642 RepID=UPI0034647A7C|nr:ISLR2 protein [Amia calva]
MAEITLGYLGLWTVFIGIAQCCPEPCVCVDKYAHQFADCAYKDLLVVPEGLPSNVTTLSLSANKITSLLSTSFVDVTQVTSLWLAHNEIVTIEKGTLAVLVQLRNLDLSHNKIVNFPWDDLYNLTALQLLKMNNNEMVNLPRDAFSTLKDLRSLRINNNKFTSILQGTFDSLSSMSHLQIYHNPFTCSCSLEWLRDWISNAQISVPEQVSIVCEAPEDLKGFQVSKIPKLKCEAPTVRITTQSNIENLSEGSMVMLQCETEGSPKPDIQWKINTGNQEIEFNLPAADTENNDLPLVNSKLGANRFLAFKNGTLIIPRISRKEDGSYTCSATNEQGSEESSVKVVVSGTVKYANTIQDVTDNKFIIERKPGPKTSETNVISWPKPEERSKTSPTGSSYITVNSEHDGQGAKMPSFGDKCGINDETQYISNHAFNQSSDELKQHTFDFGVIALEVSETEAKVQLKAYQVSPEKLPLHMLYLCVSTGNGHSVIQWSRIGEGLNSYRFQGLDPGTNYTLCLTYTGEDCQVQVVFTTRKKFPSLLIIVVVSMFLLALATVPLLGATCCHLLYKYQGKTYKLIMKAQNPDQMEKHMSADFDPRASYVESEKNFNPSELCEEEGEIEGEEGEGEGEVEGSMVNESITESQSKTNQEEFEVGSEYSDRLPLGAEAVNISEEINGNYKQPAR